MSAKALVAALNRALTNRGDLSVVVQVLAPGSIGGTPSVEITGGHAGIDWDHGKFFLRVDTELTRLSADDVAAIRESVSKGQSWHAYQAHKAQREEIVTLRAKVTALEAERDGLAKDAELERALRRAAKQLPDGYHIELCVEAGCGTVQLVEPDGVSIRDMYEDEASLADQVNAAIDAAMGASND